MNGPLFRAFVYNKLNKTDWKGGRANAVVEYFRPLDAQFGDNIVVRIKDELLDFQVREPVVSLFANLRTTNRAIELQVTQESLGKQVHLVYLPPLWKTLTNFDPLVVLTLLVLLFAVPPALISRGSFFEL